jgi:hypothetical protein
MDQLDHSRDVLFTYTNPQFGMDEVWIIVCEDKGCLAVVDGIIVNREDIHELPKLFSEADPECRYWVQRVVLNGPALNVSRPATEKPAEPNK